MADHKAWFKAASSGDEEALSLALHSGTDVNTRDTKQNTALHLATKHQHVNSIRLLIEHGADVNAQNDYASTALHLTEKNMEAIRILLEAAADPNMQDKDYDYPYYFAFYGSMSRELTELYIKHGANLVLHPDK
ncbi:MAG: ankyrin repeat domain-containing protein [Mariprofundaceae bacterium]